MSTINQRANKHSAEAAHRRGTPSGEESNTKQLMVHGSTASPSSICDLPLWMSPSAVSKRLQDQRMQHVMRLPPVSPKQHPGQHNIDDDELVVSSEDALESIAKNGAPQTVKHQMERQLIEMKIRHQLRLRDALMQEKHRRMARKRCYQVLEDLSSSSSPALTPQAKRVHVATSCDDTPLSRHGLHHQSMKSCHQTPPSSPLRCNIVQPPRKLPLAALEDKESLSPYQQLIRSCLEVFEADMDDIHSGSNRSCSDIQRGQVGIRCKFCSHQPLHWRASGGTCFPRQVDGIYQAAQNIARNHLLAGCAGISQQSREQLASAQRKGGRRGGGKQYWTQAGLRLGIVENNGRLFLHPNVLGR